MSGRDNVVDLAYARDGRMSSPAPDNPAPSHQADDSGGYVDIGLTPLRLDSEALLALITVENAGLSSDDFASNAIVREFNRLFGGSSAA